MLSKHLACELGGLCRHQQEAAPRNDTKIWAKRHASANFWSRNQFPLSNIIIFVAQFPQSTCRVFGGASRPQHCTHSPSNPSLRFLHSPSSSSPSPSSRFHVFKFDSKHRKPSAAFYYLCKIHFLLYSCCLHDDCMLLFRKLALALLHLKRWPTSPRHPQRFTTSGIRGKEKESREIWSEPAVHDSIEAEQRSYVSLKCHRAMPRKENELRRHTNAHIAQ